MKQITLLVVLGSVISFAQVEKGNSRIGGIVMFSYSSYDFELSESSESKFIISPEYSILLTDNLELGSSISFVFSEWNYEYKDPQRRDAKEISSSVAIGPHVRYYFNNSSKLVPFLEVNLYYHKIRSVDEGVLNYGFKGGLNYFINSYAALEPFVSYNIEKFREINTNTLGIGIGFNWFIK